MVIGFTRTGQTKIAQSSKLGTLGLENRMTGNRSFDRYAGGVENLMSGRLDSFNYHFPSFNLDCEQQAKGRNFNLKACSD